VAKSRKAIQTIKVIEWDSRLQIKNGKQREPSIWPDTYQIYEWIIRQALMEYGLRIGFDFPSSSVRLTKLSPTKYVAAIVQEIQEYERKRVERFNAAQEFYEYMKGNEDELTNTEIQKFYYKIGVNGENPGAWAELLTIERPEKPLSYGFERICLPRTSQIIGLTQKLSEMEITKLRSVTRSQERALRRRLGWIGNYLEKTGDNKWALDFSNYPLIKHLVYLSFATYRGIPDRPRNIHKFISGKISYLFREDQRFHGFDFSSGLSANVIRGRIKGDKLGKLLAQYEMHLTSSGLLSAELHSYLEYQSGSIRPTLTQYLEF